MHTLKVSLHTYSSNSSVQPRILMMQEFQIILTDPTMDIVGKGTLLDYKAPNPSTYTDIFKCSAQCVMIHKGPLFIKK